MSKELIRKEMPQEGISLILSTWNFAYFRYQVTSIDIEKIDQLSRQLSKKQESYSKYSINNISDKKFSHLETKIIHDFDEISDFNICDGERSRVGPTGASKLLSLYITPFFIMWDSYMRGESKKKYYSKIIKRYEGISLTNQNNYPTYSKDGQGYYKFMREMRKVFIKKNKLKSVSNQAMAKLIDEYNYVKISQEITKQIKKDKASNE